jgi:hypothetical protein
MAVIAQTKDRWGRTVALTEEDWEHVLEGHPELVHERAFVLATIAYPDFVVCDATHANRENFYPIIDWKPDGTPRRFFKVCVEYVSAGGRVITAFRSRDRKRGETQL